MEKQEKLMRWLCAIGPLTLELTQHDEWHVSVVYRNAEISGDDPDLFSALMEVAVSIKSDNYVPPDPEGLTIEWEEG